MYVIENSFPKITEIDIQSLELLIGYNLPLDYKKFLQENNGGSIRPNTFKYASFSGCTDNPSDSMILEHYHSIDFLFAISSDNSIQHTINTIRVERNYILADEKIPDDILPIASTGTGDVIFIKLTGKTSENIYLWLHYELVDGDDSGDLPQCYNSYYIASSFTEFLESLY